MPQCVTYSRHIFAGFALLLLATSALNGQAATVTILGTLIDSSGEASRGNCSGQEHRGQTLTVQTSLKPELASGIALSVRNSQDLARLPYVTALG